MTLRKFKVSCDSNKIRESVSMWVLPLHVQDSLGGALEDRMCAKNRLVSLAAFVQYE